ncbi:Ger(x)C family spore germination protein [Thermoactinomyces sp. CICC 10522]|uniref:Ger(x)C family spore germination protein n=1 Tax=Thermoactinomyces sp. CICC 10522 TaxID=2767427 RepID=UPI0018DB4F0C|nr:Ger(x)C family spore germination protein [Thermoactinomyces sp. CICC 10522]MBH8602879.1 Ger(x)C family spore germination protein [Thermoactinomyces sp. CICC 10522]
MRLNGKKLRLIQLGLIMCLTFPISGCWNYFELNELSFVTAVGYDQGRHYPYRLTFQVMNPNNIVQQPIGGGGKGGSPITVYTGEGNNIIEAIQNASNKISRHMNFSHTQIIVIGEALARKGIASIFDAKERSMEGRINVPVLIARGTTAENVISALTPLDQIPAYNLAQKVLITEGTPSKALNLTENDVVSILSTPGIDLVLSGVELSNNGKKATEQQSFQSTSPPLLAISKMGLFKKDKLVSWINNSAAIGTIFLLDKMKHGTFSINCKNKPSKVAIQINYSKTKVEASMVHGTPTFHITVRTNGDIKETDCPLNFEDPKVLSMLGKQSAKKIGEVIQSAIHAAKQVKTDVFGFGQAIHRASPQSWNKLKNHWDDLFTKAKVNLDIFVTITDSGLRKKPYEFK